MAQSDPKHVRYDFDRVVRLLLSVATFVAVVALLRYLSEVLIPFAIALLLAYLLNPIVNGVENRLKSRPVAVLLTVFGCLLLMVVMVLSFVPLVAAQLSDFQQMAAELRQEIPTPPPAPSGDTSDDAEPPTTLSERFDQFVESQQDARVVWVLAKVRDFVTSEAFDVEKVLLSIGKRVAPGIWGVLTGAVSFLLGLTGLMVVLLYVVFLLNDFRIVERTWKNHLPPAYRESVVQFLEEFRIAMSRYFRGQFVVASCVGILFAVGFSLVGLRMAIMLGLFVGLLNMVPYAQVVGMVPAGLLAILRAVENGSNVVVSLGWTLLVFAVVQLVQDTVLTPRIVGKATGLRPAIILLSIFVWGKLLGFLGVVVAIPLTCLGLAYYRRFVLRAHAGKTTD